MRRRRLLTASLVPLGAWDRPVRARASEADLVWQERHLQGLGTLLHFKVGHTDLDRGRRALAAAEQAVRAIEAELSLFQPDSALSRLNRQGHLVGAGPHLQSVLREALDTARASAGAFDPTVQPLWELFESARQAGTLPSARDRVAARARVDWRAIRMTGSDIAFTRPGMALTLNGIAQGHAADVVRQVLRAQGVQHALIDAGEFAAWGRNEHQRPWTLGLEDPRFPPALLGRLGLDGRCVATSADNQCFFSPDHRHHHIFDPHTGDSPPELRSVSVVAASARRADALTKVMFVAGPRNIPRLARRHGVGVVWLDRQGRCGATPDLAWALEPRGA